MPDKIAELLNEHPWLGGAVMAVIVSILRLVYDRKETSMIRIMLESLICGALTIAVGSGVAMLGYGQDAYLFTGGMVGFMGSQSIRALAYKLIDRKVGSINDDEVKP